MENLWIVNRWIKLPVSKSHRMMSALKPEKVFCPLAMYFPEFDTLRVEMSLVWPYD